MKKRNKQIFIILILISAIVVVFILAEIYKLLALDLDSTVAFQLRLIRSGMFFISFLLVVSFILTTFNKNEQKKRGWIVEEENNSLLNLEIESNKTSDNIVEHKELNEVTIQDIFIDNSIKNVNEIANELLSKLGKKLNLGVGLMYLKSTDNDNFNFVGSYGYIANKKPESFKEGEGLNGQVVKNKTPLYIENIPDNYVRIISGLGQSLPKYLLILPIIIKEEIIGIIEMASFSEFNIDINKATNVISDYLSDKINQSIISK